MGCFTRRNSLAVGKLSRLYSSFPITGGIGEDTGRVKTSGKTV